MGSDSFSASARISAAFLALRPPRSRIVAKTVCPLRASVSVNSLPNPVLEPLMRTTCLEFMIDPPQGATRETRLMPEVKPVVTKINSTDCRLENETANTQVIHQFGAECSVGISF